MNVFFENILAQEVWKTPMEFLNLNIIYKKFERGFGVVIKPLFLLN